VYMPELLARVNAEGCDASFQAAQRLELLMSFSQAWEMTLTSLAAGANCSAAYVYSNTHEGLSIRRWSPSSS